MFFWERRYLLGRFFGEHFDEFRWLIGYGQTLDIVNPV